MQLKVLCLVVPVALAKCRTPEASTTSATAAPAMAVRGGPDGGAHERAARLRALVVAWNAAINAHDANKLAGLYADEVELYGKRLSRATAVAVKKASFAHHVRDTIDDIAVTDEGRATFHKNSLQSGGKLIEVDAYLDEEGGKIVSEGDTTTDTNLARARETTCELAVLQLVEQTAEAKTATKTIEEGAKSSPLPVSVGGYAMPPDVTGAGWGVAICENYVDRMPCYHHFNVDPATATVTYTNGGLDDRPIVTDPALAAKVRAACKPLTAR